MREIGRSGVGRCTASPVPFARATAARRGRPGGATVRAFIARRAAGPAGPLRWRQPADGSDLVAELRRGIPARAPRPGRRPRPERAPVPSRSVPGEGRARTARVAGLPRQRLGGEASGHPRRPVRLTRRGRVVVLGLVLLLGALFGFLAASPGQAADPPRPAVTAGVQPGDTLWSFAERNLPRWHTIDAVAELQRLNHLEGSVIHPGQRLVLPARR
jgi:hypothetical protein